MNITKHIPNTITSMNLLCGVMGVIYTFNGSLDIAFYLMLAAALCDFCDGLAARLLNAYSPIGKELDSLADMVSFGVLPALMMQRVMTDVHGENFLSYIPLIITVFSAVRLAKFNLDDRQTDNFIGLATPACAMICGSYACYITCSPSSIPAEWATCALFIPTVSVILSFLLISELPMFSIKLKKGMKFDDPVNRKRITFIAIMLLIAIIVISLNMHWSIIITLSFLSYIIMNIIIKLFVKG